MIKNAISSSVLENGSPISRRCLMQGAAAACTLLARGARAQAFPGGNVKLVVPWPAGSQTDELATRLQPLFAAAVGQSVAVENVPGAGGMLGTDKVMAAPQDGHTVLVSTPIELILSPLTQPSATYTAADFRMVGMFGRAPYLLVSRANLPQKTLADVLALKADRGARPPTYGSIGNGSLIHLMSAKFSKLTGVSMLHAPYPRLPPMLQALLGAQIDFGFVPLSELILDFIAQGTLRCFGVTSVEPVASLPQVDALCTMSPLLAEFKFEMWAGLHLPRGVPMNVAERWHSVFYECTKEPYVRIHWRRTTGTELMAPLSLSELRTFYERDIQQYLALVRFVGALS
jgi:tripartite-type tricarboxylate transporter receptor subunit TctC